MSVDRMDNAEAKIGYKFRNTDDLEIVFNRIVLDKRGDYRILAGYGDAILRFAAWEYLVTSEYVFKSDKKTFKEEFGAKINNLVSDKNLRKISTKMGLTLTADGIEALLGAVYNDGGFEEAKKVAKRMLGMLT